MNSSTISTRYTKIGYIYAIENNFDTGVYVGLTIKTIKERFAQHLQAARSKKASCILHLFMSKHGPENFFIRVHFILQPSRVSKEDN